MNDENVTKERTKELCDVMEDEINKCGRYLKEKQVEALFDNLFALTLVCGVQLPKRWYECIGQDEHDEAKVMGVMARVCDRVLEYWQHVLRNFENEQLGLVDDEDRAGIYVLLKKFQDNMEAHRLIFFAFFEHLFVKLLWDGFKMDLFFLKIKKGLIFKVEVVVDKLRLH
ncbi:hypothetical protein RFI_23648 [Reticulomyxa filosa]|uniref:Uncharacterized protein n=1 Tax=Reticulomyxa filosa TaxID=46433 RepID=X6MKW8_RETFI|nr:hypothetical protein RFI_23648 [Reticulomyxa filosa]|eukprot:ETO13720.1 hypothetical protein RFI_23648 [Reticulomyxa filosa]